MDLMQKILFCIIFVLVPVFSDRLSDCEIRTELDFEGARWKEKHPVITFDAECTKPA